jgi:hypothetical protein
MAILKRPTNPHWARVVGYGPFSLCVIHKEGLCPSSGDINRLMMMNPKDINFNLNTYRSRFIPERVAKTSQLFLLDVHVIQKLLSYKEYCRCDRW